MLRRGGIPLHPCSTFGSAAFLVAFGLAGVTPVPEQSCRSRYDEAERRNETGGRKPRSRRGRFRLRTASERSGSSQFRRSRPSLSARIGGSTPRRCMRRPDGIVMGRALAGPVISAGRVLYVRSIHYSGPVYNFESSSNVLVADGIINHNCRCTVTFEIKRGGDGNS